MLLLSIAALAYSIWPGVSWKYKGEKAIGFDVAKGLVYTVKSEDGKHELQGYDLWSGEKRVTVGLEPETSLATPTFEIMLGNEPVEEKRKRYAQEWKWILSPNKKELIAINRNQTTFKVVDLNSGRVVKNLLLGDEIGHIFLTMLVSMTSNGSIIIMQNVWTVAVSIWDLKTGARKDEIPYRRVSYHAKGFFEIQMDRTQIDPIGRYIAYSRGEKAILYDTVSKKQVVLHSSDDHRQHDPNLVPRFLSDGKQVVFTPLNINQDHKVSWYRKTEDDSWAKVPLELASSDLETRFVGYSESLLLTNTPTRSKTNRPNWVPEFAWNWGNRLFGFSGTRYQLQFWDLYNGNLVRRFRFFEPTNSHGYFADEFDSVVFISEDGRWLAREYEDEITVYDTLERRSIWCWAVVVILVLLAVWCGWPRRNVVPVAPPHPSVTLKA